MRTLMNYFYHSYDVFLIVLIFIDLESHVMATRVYRLGSHILYLLSLCIIGNPLPFSTLCVVMDKLDLFSE